MAEQGRVYCYMLQVNSLKKNKCRKYIQEEEVYSQGTVKEKTTVEILQKEEEHHGPM